MPKIVDKNQMRRKIMDAAMQQFIRSGIHATTIEMIATEAGLGKGTLYLYFKSREELVIQLVEAIFIDMEERLAPPFPSANLGEFVAHLHNLLDVPQEQAGFIRVFFQVFGGEFRSPEFAANVAAYFERLGESWREQIEYLQKAGDIRADVDAALAARTLVAMTDGIILHKGLFHIEDQRYQSMIKEAVALFANGLKTPTP